jgi:hypothetical protein
MDARRSVSARSPPTTGFRVPYRLKDAGACIDGTEVHLPIGFNVAIPLHGCPIAARRNGLSSLVVTVSHQSPEALIIRFVVGS